MTSQQVGSHAMTLSARVLQVDRGQYGTTEFYVVTSTDDDGPVSGRYRVESSIDGLRVYNWTATGWVSLIDYGPRGDHQPATHQAAAEHAHVFLHYPATFGS